MPGETPKLNLRSAGRRAPLIDPSSILASESSRLSVLMASISSVESSESKKEASIISEAANTKFPVPPSDPTPPWTLSSAFSSMQPTREPSSAPTTPAAAIDPPSSLTQFPTSAGASLSITQSLPSSLSPTHIMFPTAQPSTTSHSLLSSSSRENSLVTSSSDAISLAQSTATRRVGGATGRISPKFPNTSVLIPLVVVPVVLVVLFAAFMFRRHRNRHTNVGTQEDSEHEKHPRLSATQEESTAAQVSNLSTSRRSVVGARSSAESDARSFNSSIIALLPVPSTRIPSTISPSPLPDVASKKSIPASSSPEPDALELLSARTLLNGQVAQPDAPGQTAVLLTVQPTHVGDTDSSISSPNPGRAFVVTDSTERENRLIPTDTHFSCITPPPPYVQ